MLVRTRAAIAAAVPSKWKIPIKRALGLPLTRLHPDWSILEVIGPVLNEHMVLDIGAHHGWFFHCWQDWCPKARVIALEPYGESFETMHRLYGRDPRVRLIQGGVGAEPGELELNVLQGSKVSNSFLNPAEKAWREIEYVHGEISRVSVPVTTVDEIFRQAGLDKVYLLKIDVQGYEMEVLKGAGHSLASIDHIFVESGIQSLYEGAPRFSDVFEFLTARGFHLIALRSWHRGNHVLVETDMLFRRDELARSIDSSVDRIFERNG